MLSEIQNQILVARLTRTEGRKNKLYVDTVGKITGGVGHDFTDKGLPNEVIDLLLKLDILEAYNDAATIRVFPNLDPIRQTVLIDMVFNMGLDSVKAFVNTLHYIELGRFDEAANQMLQSKWAQEVGNRAIELAEIMRTGEVKGVS